MKGNIKLRGKLQFYMFAPILITILLVLLNIPVYRFSLETGLVASGFTVIYFIVVSIIYTRFKPAFLDELVNFATQYSIVQKKLLNELELPYALVDSNGKLLWVNEKFTEITGRGKGYNKSVATIFSQITKELLQKSKGNFEMHISYGGADYRVQLRPIEFTTDAADSDIVEIHGESDYLVALYLFDETELNRYIRENDAQRLVAGLIYIDNYEEALNSIQDVKRSLLIALVDRKVNKYFAEVDGLVRKVEKDKYFVIFRHMYLQKMEEDKFSIIEEVKSVKVGNEMSA